MTSTEIDLGSRPGDWFPSGQLATVRLEVETHANTPVFVGIGPDAEVDAFLEGVAQAEVTGIGPDPGDITYRTVPGDAPLAAPAEQTFWAASAQGVGTQTLTWDLEKANGPW